VIVAIPEKSIPELPAGLLSSLPADTVVIDAGNYVPKARNQGKPGSPGCVTEIADR
jgi:hypothetical protein